MEQGEHTSVTLARSVSSDFAMYIFSGSHPVVVRFYFYFCITGNLWMTGLFLPHFYQDIVHVLPPVSDAEVSPHGLQNVFYTVFY